jgi:hypothetical protein
VTRADALALLSGDGEVGYGDVDAIFIAFGFVSASPDFETEVYSHPKFKRCGAFTARDDGIHVLTPLQKGLVRAILRCVEFHEAFTAGG